MVKIIFLGGIGEIGKNMTAIEDDDTVIVIDCGVSFQGNKEFYSSYRVQDFSYLLERKNKVKAIILTHGHEDHIGNLQFFNNCFPDAQIIGSPFTIELIKSKFNEHIWKEALLKKVYPRNMVDIGAFNIEFIHTNHSIPGSYMLSISTEEGRIVHTGDFKIDLLATKEPVTDMRRLKELGEEGVSLLLTESTNSERRGTSKSEFAVIRALKNIIEADENRDKRIVVTLFATNVTRVCELILLAKKAGRAVLLLGSSLKATVKAAQKTGLYKFDKNLFIEENETFFSLSNELMIITTGCQGETGSGMRRLADNEYGQTELTENDVVVFSSSVIPGNEKNVESLKQSILKRGSKIIDKETVPDVHASGHAYQGEIRMLINTLKPLNIVTIHGESSHMKANSLLCKETAADANVIIPHNGTMLSLKKGTVAPISVLPIKNCIVDSTRENLISGEISGAVMLAGKPIAVVSVAANSRTKTMYDKISVETIGFALPPKAIDMIRDCVESALREDLASRTFNIAKVVAEDAIHSILIDKYEIDARILCVVVNLANSEEINLKNKNGRLSYEEMADIMLNW